MSKSHRQRYRKQKRAMGDALKAPPTPEEFAELIRALDEQYTPDISYDDWINGRRHFEPIEEQA